MKAKVVKHDVSGLPKQGRMTVAVYLTVTVDIDDYALNYGVVDVKQIRSDIRWAVNDAVNSGAVMSAGIVGSELHKATR